MPIDFKLPLASKKPVTPTTEFNLRSASVVAGSSRLTLPSLICCLRASGNASTSTSSPTASAVFGLTPLPTPPCFSPAMAVCSRSASPQNASLPSVSYRKICRPCSSICCAWCPIRRSTLEVAAALVWLPLLGVVWAASLDRRLSCHQPASVMAITGARRKRLLDLCVTTSSLAASESSQLRSWRSGKRRAGGATVLHRCDQLAIEKGADARK